MTRQDYLMHKVSHEEYYRHIAKLAGIAFNPEDPFIERVRRALANGDEHLNSISLQTWDIRAAGAYHAIVKAMKEVDGEFYSLAGGVCVMKQAAKDAAEKGN